MDAFFASVEQLDFPELRGKAIAVGVLNGVGWLLRQATKQGAMECAVLSAVHKHGGSVRI